MSFDQIFHFHKQPIHRSNKLKWLKSSCNLQRMVEKETKGNLSLLSYDCSETKALKKEKEKRITKSLPKKSKNVFQRLKLFRWNHQKQITIQKNNDEKRTFNMRRSAIANPILARGYMSEAATRFSF